MTIRQRPTLYWVAVLAAILIITACSVFVIFRRQQLRVLSTGLAVIATPVRCGSARESWRRPVPAI
jgi:hypothetical protein